MQPLLSVVIPNYNELENLKRGVLDQVFDYLRQKKYSYEVIICEDNSTDGSREFIREYGKNEPRLIVLENEHIGKAGGLKVGISAATGKYILTTDMDQSTPFSEIDKLMSYIDQGYAAIIGSRGRQREASTIFRRIASNIFILFRRSLLLGDIVDTQCGFKLYQSDILKKIFPKLGNFSSNKKVTGWVVSAFDVELLFMIEKMGGKIKEVPVEWRNEDTSSSKSRKFIKESLDMLKQISRVKLLDIQGKYEKLV